MKYRTPLEKYKAKIRKKLEKAHGVRSTTKKPR